MCVHVGSMCVFGGQRTALGVTLGDYTLNHPLSSFEILLKYISKGAEEMTQQLRAHAALPDDPSLYPNTHYQPHKSSKGSNGTLLASTGRHT